MELGTCPTCATPYSAADLAGLGILRSRPALQGGPLLEYRCASCRTVLTLVPHGEGRYAPPGVPPPPPVPVEARRPHWARAPGRAEPTTQADAGPEPRPQSTTRATRAGEPPTPAQEPPLDLLEAYALLGVPVTAPREEIERAFRNRSLACHPDKVTHLDAEFQDLAERKFKRLMEAFRLVSQVLPP